MKNLFTIIKVEGEQPIDDMSYDLGLANVYDELTFAEKEHVPHHRRVVHAMQRSFDSFHDRVRSKKGNAHQRRPRQLSFL